MVNRTISVFRYVSGNVFSHQASLPVKCTPEIEMMKKKEVTAVVIARAT
jgi:hypothetical protein